MSVPTFQQATVTGVADGTNTVFSLSPAPTSGVLLFVNGKVQQIGVQFNLIGSAVVFAAGHVPPNAAEVVAWVYQPGSGLSAGSLAGIIDGSNATFIVSPFPLPSGILLFKQGLFQSPGGGGVTGGFNLLSITGTIDGSNPTFTLGATPAFDAIILFVDGLAQQQGVDFNLSGLTITFTAGNIPQSNSTVSAWGYTLASGLAPAAITGAINNSNAAFTVSPVPTSGEIWLFKNGMFQFTGSGNDYTLSGSTITFESGNIPQTNDVLVGWALNAGGGGYTAVTVSGTIDSANAFFTLSSAGAVTLLFNDGLAQQPGVDFTVVGTAVTFASGSIPQTDAILAGWISGGGAGAGGYSLSGSTVTFGSGNIPITNDVLLVWVPGPGTASFTPANLIGPVDGVNSYFTLSTSGSTTLLFMNGFLQDPGEDYTQSGAFVTFATPPAVDSVLAAWVATTGVSPSVTPSVDLFPYLPGIGWSAFKTPEGGATIIQRSTSGKERTISLRSAGRPIWNVILTYEVLRAARGLGIPMYGQYQNIAQVPNADRLLNVDTLTENEFSVLCGFFIRENGSGRQWLFDDPYDNTVGLFVFGQGNGTQTAWRTFFNGAWQAQFPSAPILYTDRSINDVQEMNSFQTLPAVFDGNGLITPTSVPVLFQPLYITAPTASYAGHPLLGEQFGTGDGFSTSFQLTRTMGGTTFGYAEPIQNLNGTPTIWIDGILQTPAIGATGVVTFMTPPDLGAVLSWSGKFYMRLRFLKDSTEFEMFANALYSVKQIEATSILL